MGTSKSGRYLNTEGAANSVSDFVLVHADEGKYTQPSRKRDELRLISGGHGQINLEQLDKYGIEYIIEKTYLNGVRVGNVPNHKERSKRKGMNQTWFPKNWTNKDIKKAGEHVVSLKKNQNVEDGKIIFGTYKGVRVGVIKTNGRIGTVFPDKDQNYLKRRKKDERKN